MPKFNTQWTYNPNSVKGWNSDLPSLSIPEESYSLRDLFQKYAGGNSIISSQFREGNFDDEYNSDNQLNLDAPLSPDRLMLTDPVDVETHIQEHITPYVNKVKSDADDKVRSYIDNQQKNINDQKDNNENKSKQNVTTTNDDAN